METTGTSQNGAIKTHTSEPWSIDVFLPVMWWKKPWKQSCSCLWCRISSYTRHYRWTKPGIPCSVQMLVMGNICYCCGSEQELAGVQASSGGFKSTAFCKATRHTSKDMPPCWGSKTPRISKTRHLWPPNYIIVQPTRKNVFHLVTQKKKKKVILMIRFLSRILHKSSSWEQDSFPQGQKKQVKREFIKLNLNCRKGPHLNEIF